MHFSSCSARPAGRQGSSDEVALLVADFGLLDTRLAAMRDSVDAGEAEFIDADDLAAMASDVPDLCSRLGIGCGPSACATCWLHRALHCNPHGPLTAACSCTACSMPRTQDPQASACWMVPQQTVLRCCLVSACTRREDTVFRGPGWTLVRLKGSVQDVGAKVSEGANFFGRGLRLLGTDLSVAGRYFSRAALGEPSWPGVLPPLACCEAGGGLLSEEWRAYALWWPCAAEQNVLKPAIGEVPCVWR